MTHDLASAMLLQMGCRVTSHLTLPIREKCSAVTHQEYSRAISSSFQIGCRSDDCLTEARLVPVTGMCV